MDGGAAIREDAARDEPRRGGEDTTHGHNACPSAEDPAELDQCSIACKDCGLRFTHWDVFKTHLHQHALEEEEAQTGDNRSPAAELDSGKVDDGENTVGDADGCDVSSSLQTNPSGVTESVKGDTGSTNKQLGKIHACLICGKVYTYWLSFWKHQKLHEKPKSKSPEPSVQNLNKYQCPECGKSFIRRARLLGHLKVHRSVESTPPRCDQCNKDFASVKSWMSHVDFHKRKPFWCSCCARGFKEAKLLEKHTQSHDLWKYTCNICHKRFGKLKPLRIHYNSHTGAKPYQCTFCGKSFSQPGNLISHRKQHLRVYVGSSGMHLGIKNSANYAKKQAIEKKRLLARVKEEREVDTNTEERVKKNETGTPWEDAVFESRGPVRHFKISKPSKSAGSVQSELKSETIQPRTAQELHRRESRETNGRNEHKDWEWECLECYMCFDEVAKLHLHYIKHATGELPIPQDYNEG